MHHITQHARSHLAGHTFLGHARPRKIETSQPHLGLTERSARRSKSYARRGLGPSPIAHLHIAYVAGSRPSNLHYKGSHVTRSISACAAPSLMSRRLRLIPRRRVPISFPRSWLVRIDQMARLRSNTKILLSVLINVTADTNQGQEHLSPRWSQPALWLRQKVHIEGRRDCWGT